MPRKRFKEDPKYRWREEWNPEETEYLSMKDKDWMNNDEYYEIENEYEEEYEDNEEDKVGNELSFKTLKFSIRRLKNMPIKRYEDEEDEEEEEWDWEEDEEDDDF
jgi:hypothetical protein